MHHLTNYIYMLQKIESILAVTAWQLGFKVRKKLREKNSSGILWVKMQALVTSLYNVQYTVHCKHSSP